MPLTDYMVGNLDNKLRRYLALDEDTRKRKYVIFTSRPEIWNTERQPVIISRDPFPVISFGQPGARKSDASKEVIAYYDWCKAEEGLDMNLYVLEFVERGAIELQIIFYKDENALPKPSSKLLRDPDQYMVPATESSSVSAPKSSLQFVRALRSASVGSGVGPSLVTDLTSEFGSSIPHQSTSSAGTSTSAMVAPDDNGDDDEITPVFDEGDGSSTIGSRLSEELKKNVNQKVNVYRSKYADTTHASVIFTDSADGWKTDRDPVIVTNLPMPPVPADYDHVNYNIGLDICEYAHQLARRKRCKQFHAYFFNSGEADGSQIHLLFSKFVESAEIYRVNADHSLTSAGCPSSSAPASSMSVSSIMVVAEYREYSSGAADAASFTKAELVIERGTEVKSLTSDSGLESLDDDESSSKSITQSADEETRSIVLRLSAILKRNLDKKMETFLKRREEAKLSAVIFTDDKDIWNADKEPLIVIEPLPPIPSDYDHQKFDIAGDMVAYMRTVAARNRIEPFYVSTLLFGEKSDLQAHFLLSQYEEKMQLYCADSQAHETRSMSPDPMSAATPMDSSLDYSSESTVRRRLDSQSAQSTIGDSLESIDDIPVDDFDGPHTD